MREREVALVLDNYNLYKTFEMPDVRVYMGVTCMSSVSARHLSVACLCVYVVCAFSCANVCVCVYLEVKWY